MYLCHCRLCGWVLAWTGEAHALFGMVHGWDKRICCGLGTSLSIRGPSWFLSVALTLTEEHGEDERLS